MTEDINPRAVVGDNSDLPAAGHDASVRHIVLELNKCRQERRALNDDEKDVKAQLKVKGLSAKAQAIGRRARKSKKEEPQCILQDAQRFIEDEAFRDERAELDRISDEKREIGRRERDLKKAAIEKNIQVRALPIVRAMQEMDSLEREALFDGIVNQCKALRFW